MFQNPPFFWLHHIYPSNPSKNIDRCYCTASRDAPIWDHLVVKNQNVNFLDFDPL
jgi:hypothetical protein